MTAVIQACTSWVRGIVGSHGAALRALTLNLWWNTHVVSLWTNLWAIAVIIVLHVLKTGSHILLNQLN